ncbi:MAG: hypothetical protein R3D26_10740 [Cyanobacteriota/Melainabacteria group bacterium]
MLDSFSQAGLQSAGKLRPGNTSSSPLTFCQHLDGIVGHTATVGDAVSDQLHHAFCHFVFYFSTQSLEGCVSRRSLVAEKPVFFDQEH